jgi:hypothetical protein
MAGASWWKASVAVVALLAFVCLGIAHIVNPDYFIRRSAVRKGGQLLTDWNRMSFQLVGGIVAAFAVYILWHMFRS